MSNFMIGMYGKYDNKKFDRDFRTGFYGVEACLFENEKDIENLINEAKHKDFKLGIHFPKPVILKENFEKRNWRFADGSEYTYESEYPYNELKEKCEYLFQWLSEKSFEYSFIPVLEFDALNKYICENNFLENLLEKYKRIKVCLDTGRLHLQHKIDSDFNDIDIIKRFSKYAEVVHL